MTKRKIQYWVIPPEQDTEFVSCMEEVLETYAQAYEPIEVARLLDTRYAECEQVTLVLDNLNTHTKGAFYEVFDPEHARAYIKRIRFCYTPKHGSWLNIAECELSCLTSQCLSDRHIGELSELEKEISAWSDKAKDPVLGDSAGTRYRICVLHGRGARNLRPGVRTEASRALYGRATRPVVQGNANADRRNEEACQTCRLLGRVDKI